MTRESAHDAVATSAFIVAVIFAYRKLVEGSTGSTTTGSTGSFLVGFLFLYVTLSVVADIAPPLGGMFAWLVAAGDLLTNGQALVNDLNSGLHAEATAAAPATTTTATVAATPTTTTKGT